MQDIYFLDADDLLLQLAEQPNREDRDHLIALAQAHALASVAKSLADIRSLLAPPTAGGNE